jgi:hypothetical protein
MRGKFLNRLKWLTRDTRFILCAGCVLSWLTLLPPRSYHGPYLATDQGQMSFLLASALLLWIGNAVARLASVGLCALALYAMSLGLGAGREFLSLSLESRPDEGPAALSLRVFWRDALVIACGVSIIWYAGRRRLRSIPRPRPRLP